MQKARRADRLRRAIPAAALLLAVALALAACAPAAPTVAVAPRARAPGLVAPELHTFPDDGRVELSWDAMPDAASYTLYWSSEPDVAAKPQGQVAGITGTQYVHKGLANGEAVYYYLVAIDAGGKPLRGYPPIGDIPHVYPVHELPGFVAVTARPHDTFDTLAARYLHDASKGWLIADFNDRRTLAPFQAVLIPLHPYEPGGLTHKGYHTVPVLTYHQLSRTKSTKMAVLQSSFELQMAYLKRNRYQVITLDQFVDFLEFKGQVPDRAVVITFDDGWASTYTIALPILKRYGFKATLFLETDLVGANKLALTWDQVQELEDSGVVDIQCHTQSHPNLADPKDRDLKGYLDFLEKEIAGNRAVIKQHLGKECRYLAYPYGATNHLVVAMAQREGLRAGFTVDRGANPFFVTNYRILRSMVYGEYDLKQFAANLESFSNRVLK